MELRMNFTTFIKLKDGVKINDISGEILDYKLNERELEGIFSIHGTYLKDDLDKEFTFKEDVPFNILFMEKNVEIEDLDCIDLDYDFVEGRGIDVSFDLKAEYTVEDEEERVDEIKVVIDEIIEDTDVFDEGNKDTDENDNKDEDETEVIKDEITCEIDRKLIESLSYKEDNRPTEESIVSRIKDEKKCIKVFYYEDDKELERICKNNNVSLDQVFKENKNNDINKYQRVILK